MEQENVKGKNNNQDGVPLLEGKNSVDDASSSSSSPSTSSIQDHNSSEKPQLVTDDEDEKITNTPLSSENANSEAMMKSPPTQMMGGALPEPPGYDPNRIPASVFAKSNTAGEWSVASNESLFSIHMGNNSFSRDYAILFGKSGEFPRPEDWPGPQPNPFGKSGELPRLEDWNNNINNNDQVVMVNNNSLPPVMEVPAHEENSMQSGEFSRSEKKEEEEKSPTVENHENPTVATVSAEVAKKEHIAESPKTSSPSNTLPPYSSPPRFSSGSGHSGSSFAFPVLVSESGKTAGSLKVVPEKEEVLLPEGKEEEVSKENIPADASATTETKSWFPCFACWPRCC